MSARRIKVDPINRLPRLVAVHRLPQGDRDTLAYVLSHPVVCVYHASFASRPPEPLDFSELSDEAVRSAENQVFLWMNYCRWMMMPVLAQYHEGFIGAEACRSILRWAAPAQDARCAIIVANQGLARAAVAKFGARPGLDDELASAAFDHLVKIVDYFDVSRGFKFSSLAMRSMLRELSRVVAKETKHSSREQTGQSVDVHGEDSSVGDRMDLREALARNGTNLTPRERAFVRRYYGLDGRRASSFENARRFIRANRKEAREIEASSLDKLRVALSRGST